MYSDMYIHLPTGFSFDCGCVFGPLSQHSSLIKYSKPKSSDAQASLRPLHWPSSPLLSWVTTGQPPGSKHIRYQNNQTTMTVMVGLGFLSLGHRQPAGHKGHLIRPSAPLWCERLSGPFDSLLLSQQEVVGDNWHRISLLTSGRLCGLKWQRSPEESRQ